MTRLNKKALIVLSLMAFLVLTPTLILFAQGYRFDHESRLHKTGGLFVEATPRFAEVLISPTSGPVIKMKNSSFVDGLQPQTYTLQITAPQYTSWSQDIVVKPQRVTRINQINLIAKAPKPEVISSLKTIGDFAADDLGQNILAQSMSGKLYLIRTNQVSVINLNPNTPRPDLNSAIWLDARKLLALHNSGLYLYELIDNGIDVDLSGALLASNVLAFDFYRNLVFTFSSDALITSYDLGSNRAEVLMGALISLDPHKLTAFKVVNTQNALLGTDNGLYGLDLTTKAIVRVMGPVELLALSPNHEQVLTIQDRFISLLNLARPELPQPLLIKTDEGVTDLFWDITNDHFFFKTMQGLHYVETLPDHTRMVAWLNIATSKVHLAKTRRILYGLFEGMLNKYDLSPNPDI